MTKTVPSSNQNFKSHFMTSQTFIIIKKYLLFKTPCTTLFAKGVPWFFFQFEKNHCLTRESHRWDQSNVLETEAMEKDRRLKAVTAQEQSRRWETQEAGGGVSGGGAKRPDSLQTRLKETTNTIQGPDPEFPAPTWRHPHAGLSP